MQLFRRHIFRRLASVLTLALLLGGSASVWSSVDELLTDNHSSTSSCPMHSKHDQHNKGNCCTGQSDCVSLCGDCSVPATSSVLAASVTLSVSTLTTTQRLEVTKTYLPDGTSSAAPFRPPISRA